MIFKHPQLNRGQAHLNLQFFLLEWLLYQITKFYKVILHILANKSQIILKKALYTSPITSKTIFSLTHTTVMKHFKTGPFIIVKTVAGIKLHALQKMIKATNKNSPLFLKMINMHPTNTSSNFIIFCGLQYYLLNFRNKTVAVKYKIKIKQNHYLFF